MHISLHICVYITIDWIVTLCCPENDLSPNACFRRWSLLGLGLLPFVVSEGNFFAARMSAAASTGSSQYNTSCCSPSLSE